jgi:hypothetical protein
LYLGWRFRVTAEEIAIREIQTELDGIFYTWQQPELKKMTPIQPEYQDTTKLPDGTTKVVTRYHDDTYLLIPNDTLSAPQPDMIDRWLDRSPRVHVYGVLLPKYNVSEENLEHLKQMPYLHYVVVRNVHEPEGGLKDPTLTKVRDALPNVEVVGERWKLHPKNQK